MSLLSVWGCFALRSQFAWQGTVIELTGESVVMTQEGQMTNQDAVMADALSILQIALPVLFFVCALFVTVSMFYNLKLKRPLAMLEKGAARIIENDLDFTMESPYTDEMGALCRAFETMRKTLLKNHQELWRQAEERKRLNAAFSHNLRNPVTVLKGSVKLAETCMEGAYETGLMQENFARIKAIHSGLKII